MVDFYGLYLEPWERIQSHINPYYNLILPMLDLSPGTDAAGCALVL